MRRRRADDIAGPAFRPAEFVPRGIPRDGKMPLVGNRQREAQVSPAVAVGLSALLEGFGQAYNRQPVKVISFLTAGLTLSTVSGLNSWLARNLLRPKNTRIGPDQLRPGPLALWAATYTLNLVDAWRTARRAQAD
jgi:hypothetical protein